VSWIVFLGVCIFFGAASGCKTLLFASVFYHGKNASTSKTFKKMLLFAPPPRRELIARPPPGRVQNKAIRTSYAHQNFTAQNEGF